MDARAVRVPSCLQPGARSIDCKPKRLSSGMTVSHEYSREGADRAKKQNRHI